ncbi:MAG: hypothetical protein ACPL7A_02740 [Anaerolineales bacterium]
MKIGTKKMNSINRFAQAYQTTPWRKHLSMGMLAMVALLVVILASSLYLDVTARAAAYGRSILIMEGEIADLEMINAHLRTQLGILTSSAVMEKRALEMGFRRIEAGEEMFLVVPGYVPIDQVIANTPAKKIQTVAVSLPRVYTESLFEWLKSQIQKVSLPKQENGP